jgi:putative transposase
MGTRNRQPYATDITDAAWRYLKPPWPSPKTGGRPRRHARREILHAMFYVLRSGCAGRLMPHDRPPWQTVYHYFRRGRLPGLWDKPQAALHAAARLNAGRHPQPRAAIIARQAVTTSLVGGPRGADGGKKGHGRKRPLLVATQGLVSRAGGHPAKITDRDGARLLMAPPQGQRPCLEYIGAESAYSGKAREWMEATWSCPVEIVKHWWTGARWVWGGPGQAPPTIPRGFHVLPRRWVVERTFAWLLLNRRLSRDDEELPATSEALSPLARSRLMVKRLAHT